MTIALCLSLLSILMVVSSAVIVTGGIMEMKKLGDTELCVNGVLPRVSVIVPACNEGKNIKKAILSLLDQEYENKEIIVINDRSTDNTAMVLEGVRRNHPSVRILTLTEVADGWMGKSHALDQGAKMSTGEIILFTDADVIMEKTTISRAVNYFLEKKLDHLSLLFKNTTRGWLLNSLILDSGMALLLVFKPWRVRKDTSSCFIGVGAFNMIGRSVYKKIGGHRSIRMHPIDDVMLGKRVKQNGYRQDCLVAQDYVTIPWYGSVSEMVEGLLKNTFSVLHYRLAFVPLQLLLIFIANIYPFVGALWCEGAVQAICLLSLMVRSVLFCGGLHFLGLPVWYLAGSFLTPVISAYIVIKSAFVTTRNNGIFWRGRFYALQDLKKARPLLF